MSLKVAIVGCGKIADGHVEEIGKLPGRARVVAACDREALMAEQMAARYRIPAFYDRFEELLERERPDVVHITTPPRSHKPLALQALEAGCHVYLEKPFALDGAEAAAILDRAAALGRKVTVGWASRFDPPAEALRGLIDEGVLGEVVHVESFYGYDFSGPFGTALMADRTHWVHHLPGRLLQNIIDHMLNKLIEHLPDDMPVVRAFGYVLRPQRFGDERDDLVDELRVSLQGARQSGSGTFSSHIRPVGQFVRVYGTKNVAHVDYVARTVVLESSPKLPSAIGRLVPAFEQAVAYAREAARNVRRFIASDFHYFAGLRRQLELFYDSILGDGAPPITARDILRVTRVMDEIFRQLDAARAPRAVDEGAAS